MMMYQMINSAKFNYYTHLCFTDTVMPSHFHGCYEVLWAVHGQSCLTLDRASHQLEEGRICLVMENQIHSFFVSPGSELWVMVFSGDLVEPFHRESSQNAYPLPIFQPSETLVQMIPLSNESDFPDRYYMRAFLYRLCHEFICSVAACPARNDTDIRVGHEILSFINEHYTQHISLEMLAHEFGLNPHYISSLLAGITHQNFRAYLNSYRVEKAREMLRTTTLPITVIALDSGFETLRTFNRVFFSATGVTPREYRGSIRQTASETVNGAGAITRQDSSM